MTTGSGDFSIGGVEWPGLSKLIEEAGEVIQVAGKIIGNHGGLIHYDGTNLLERLESELGDLLAAVHFVIAHNGLSNQRIADRGADKAVLFEAWRKGGQ